MPSILAKPSSQSPSPSLSLPQKKKFRTVLGLSSLASDPAAVSTPLTSAEQQQVPVPIPRPSKRHARQASNVTEVSFFEPESDPAASIPASAPPQSTTFRPLKVGVTTTMTRQGSMDISAGTPVRTEPQGGPWTVSVAETPQERRSYTLYIRTPTHNLTLLRNATEIIDLHSKLVDACSSKALPTLPIQRDTVRNHKRRSSFLHTLSRLANPMSLKSPLVSPTQELNDPFLAAAQPAQSPAPALAAYLTTVANDPAVRNLRHWKRFVRVRTDDLQSVRAERAIKRVRSDLASHAVPRTIPMPRDAAATPSISLREVEVDPSASTHSLAEAVARASFLGENIVIPEAGSADAEDSTQQEVAEAGPSAEAKEEEVKAENALPSEEQKEDNETQIVDPDLSDVLQSIDIIAGISIPASPVTASPPPEEAGPSSSLMSISTTTTEPTTVEPASSKEVSPIPSPTADLAPSLPHTPTQQKQELPPQPETPVPESQEVRKAKKGRSASADPHKTSRSWKPSPLNSTLQADGETDAEGGDAEEGASESGRKRRKKVAKKVGVDDFEMLRVLGKGCAGKVLLVRHRKSTSLYALKAITKRHVLAHQELQHTLTEQAVLKRMARESKDPFVVKLWWSFHDKENLYLVMDFHPGGDLATQLARWGRLGRDRARFYAAEIVEGVEGLHNAGVIYRDLKPENILIGADGHIVLTDFGLSKEFVQRRPVGHNGATGNGLLTAPATPGMKGAGGEFADISQGDFFSSSSPSTPAPVTPHWMTPDGENQAELFGNAQWPASGAKDQTSTFCGTAEYLAPEVIQCLPYSYEVDWWSFGTMLYEMLTGITPFWASSHSDMYMRVLHDELTFPEDKAMDQDTKSLIRGLLQRNPALRMSEPRVKKHPYFSMIDWGHVYYKRYIPPYIPPIDPSNASDTQNFDDAFLGMEPTVTNDDEISDSEREKTDVEKTDGEESLPTSNERSPANSSGKELTSEPELDSDMFDGYSFKGRSCVALEGEEDSDGSVALSDDEDDGVPEVKLDLSMLHDADGESHAAAEVASEGASDKGAEHATPVMSQAALPKEDVVEAVVEPASDIVDIVEEPLLGLILLEDDIALALAVATPLPPSPVVPAPVTPLEEEAKTPTETPIRAGSPEIPAPHPAAAAASASRPPRGGRRQKSERERAATLIKEVDEAPAADSDDDDWDLVEAPGVEDINGSKGNTLFARGVVDRYRLAVFRKSSSQQPRRASGRDRRVVSGMTTSPGTKSVTIDAAASPSPSDAKRRGRAGLSIRKSTRQFLRARSPPALASPNSSARSRATLASSSTKLSSRSYGFDPIVTSPSAPTLGAIPSLKSKSSALSSLGGSPGSSANSVNNMAGPLTPSPRTPADQDTFKKKKKGKVLSMFSSPR
ncbi:hypothetical protein BOTBODRAFT_54499 [Botryobasidium botryosum FD-172 SS1]|uniref:non-specific serine/threonine protein kinase n=1 Tax=Botryobasidium botryosum (strain FD-172 SS1) TaxID=930990 RepID=A0A067MUP6_BOTB1|nr:hypothetical protein BOTBODRAFT_54499 [Botryobasidium botryosum FD-172 SS1]